MGLLSTGGLARASSRHPWRVIGFWIVVLLIGGFFASTIGDVTTTESNFINKPESVKGYDLIKARTGQKDPLTETVIVTSKTLTVNDPDFQKVVANVTSGLCQMTDLINPADPSNFYCATTYPGFDPAAATKAGLVSADSHTTIIPVTIAPDLDKATDLTDKYMDGVHSYKTDAVSVMPIGTLSINHEFNTVSEKDLKTGESIGILAALIILVVVFGALVAAGVPILLG